MIQDQAQDAFLLSIGGVTLFLNFVFTEKSCPLKTNRWKAGKEEHTFMNNKGTKCSQLKVAEMRDYTLPAGIK